MARQPLHAILCESARAGKGELSAQLIIVREVRPEKRALPRKLANLAAATKYQRICQAAFEEADRKGLPRPDPVPHPDDLAFDARTGELCCNGPANEIERALWDETIAIRVEMAEMIEEDMRRCKEHRQILPKDRADGLKRIDRIDCMFPDAETRRKPGFNLEQWKKRQAELQRARRWSEVTTGAGRANERSPAVRHSRGRRPLLND
jgi:hypothetical protein